MLYQVYEFNHAAIAPFRTLASLGQEVFENPINPWTHTTFGKSIAAACDVFESTTRRYGKPEFDLPDTLRGGKLVPVMEEVTKHENFCDLLHFNRDLSVLPPKLRKEAEADPKVLIIAPLSGHYATLLRGTVEAMLPEHDVTITDWTDARKVPLANGHFDLNDFVDTIIRALQHLGPNTHVMAVCQPGPAALAATAIMAEDGNPCRPASLTIMGSPIDTSKSPTAPTELAETRPLSWFKKNVVMSVPFPHPGLMRRVYPGFIQLSSFMAMNMDNHVSAHRKMFQHLIEGDGDSAEKHREFYDEYLAVMDLTEEFYLQTVKEVFQDRSLARGTFKHRGRLVDPGEITDTALLTVEGEKDDISGVGQTQAAHDLCCNLPKELQNDHIEPEAGHYGVFNGSRWRKNIQPKVHDFIRGHNTRHAEK